MLNLKCLKPKSLNYELLANYKICEKNHKYPFYKTLYE